MLVARVTLRASGGRCCSVIAPADSLPNSVLGERHWERLGDHGLILRLLSRFF